jgi:3-hydroxyacyl-CoA dehydrogenase/enoyl-CoA hydratase/3-hydroxybutyryl-CoA epimerase
VVVSAVAFGRRVGKTVIVVRDHPGFWVNRILAPYLNEAVRLVQDGVDVGQVDGAMTRFGFPVGPITLLEEIGWDVAAKAAGVLFEAFGDRLQPVSGMARMTAEGRLGRKAGRGFYCYAHGKKLDVDQSAYEVVGAVPDSLVPREDVTSRLVYAMLNEAARAAGEGVVRMPRDGDVGAVFGLGFPAFRGGPLRYLDAVGADTVVAGLTQLATRYGDRFEPCPALRDAAAAGRRFHPND